MPGRLNQFQRTMLHWNDLHPYNAINVVRIPATLEPERLRRVVNQLLEAQGLTGLVLNRAAKIFHYAGGPAAGEVKIIAAGADRLAVLGAEIERQLNTGFDHATAFTPFRFFALTEPDGFSLGVIYFHAIADAEAVVLMIRDLVETYMEPGKPRPVRPLNLYPRCRDGLRWHPKLLWGILTALPRLVGNVRSSGRLCCYNEGDLSNRCTLFALDSGRLAALLRTAKDWNITLNDLFLALLMKCVSIMSVDRHQHRRRQKISLACIINLRKDLGLDGQRMFAPFLSTFVVTHEVREGLGLRELAQDLSGQTRAIKKGRLYMGAAWELALGRFMLSGCSPKQQKRMYVKNYPLWGGITNVNLNSLWEQPPGKPSFDCLGAVSTGPLVPLVLSVMTVGAGVNVAMTYQPAFIGEKLIARIRDDFRALVAALDPGPDKTANG